jgi:hypothetical protein
MKHSCEFTLNTLNIHHIPTGMNDRIALGVVNTAGESRLELTA